MNGITPYHFKNSTPEIDALTAQVGSQIQDDTDQIVAEQKEENQEIDSQNS